MNRCGLNIQDSQIGMREFQQFVDQCQLVRCVAFHGQRELSLRRVVVVLQRARMTNNRCKRRAQIVSDVGHDARLLAIGFGQLGHCLRQRPSLTIDRPLQFTLISSLPLDQFFLCRLPSAETAIDPRHQRSQRDDRGRETTGLEVKAKHGEGRDADHLDRAHANAYECRHDGSKREPAVQFNSPSE